MSNARVTSVTNEVLVKASPAAHTSALALEVLHSVQEAPPPAQPSARRRAVVIVLT